jgi:hypothetical integral membrane protein (TIGR02206 family)
VQAHPEYFKLFGPAHLGILAAVPGLAFVLARAARANAQRAAWIAGILGVLLAINEAIWYVFVIRTEGWRFPEGMPFDLCDISVWLTAAAAIARRPLPFELAWFWGVAGASMAVITPDLWEQFPSYPTVAFFIGHGGLVTVLLYLVWARMLRPRPGSMWRALIWANLYAVAMGIFNAVFKTNYMYLCRKPASASVLDYFGPWPWYIFAGEALAIAMFYLLWLPFRGGARASLNASSTGTR